MAARQGHVRIFKSVGLFGLQRTGYRTESIICVPIRTLSGEIIGVMQCLNKRNASFTSEDLDLLSEMTSQAAIALQSRQYVEQIERIGLRIEHLPVVTVSHYVATDRSLRSLFCKIYL